MTYLNGLKLGRPLAIIAASLTLSSCFMSPGSFESSMDVRKDGTFTFSYDGEIFMMTMSDLADMSEGANNQECIDESTQEPRACTEHELSARRLEDESEAAMMRAMMGGLDLSDPEAAAEFAEKVERQAGWNSVEYLGDGLFDVDFEINSTLTHDFDFPHFEELPALNGFVAANVRNDQRVRIAAPGFSGSGANPMAAMMGGMAGAFTQGMANPMNSEDGSPDMPTPPPIEGTFRIVTDAQILTNNTDEGPAPHPEGQEMVWDISPSSAAAPTVLLLLDP